MGARRARVECHTYNNDDDDDDDDDDPFLLLSRVHMHVSHQSIIIR